MARQGREVESCFQARLRLGRFHRTDWGNERSLEQAGCRRRQMAAL